MSTATSSKGEPMDIGTKAALGLGAGILQDAQVVDF